MKIPILTIGYAHFALSAKADISAILKALSQAESVEYDYIGTQKIYYPELDRHRNAIGVEYIDDSQFRAQKPSRNVPSDTREVVVTPALNGRTPLAIEGGRHA